MIPTNNPFSLRGSGKLLLGTALLLLGAALPGRGLGAEEGKAIVWKFEGENHTVFIAGSVHLLRARDYPIPPSYYRAYQQSDKIIFEIDTADMEGVGAAMKMQQLGSYQNGDTVADHVSAETFAMLREFLRERNFSEAPFMKMKPGLLSLTLSSLEAMRIGARPDLGLEMKFGALAKQDKVATGGLETIELQLGIFDDFTDEECDELLKSTIQSLADMGDTLDKLISAWRQGDVEELDVILNSEFEESEKLRDALLINRNRNWIPEIERAIAGDRSVMFMVGAGHLIGQDSVIDMLEANGHRLVQMTYPRKQGAENSPVVIKNKELDAPSDSDAAASADPAPAKPIDSPVEKAPATPGKPVDTPAIHRPEAPAVPRPKTSTSLPADTPALETGKKGA